MSTASTASIDPTTRAVALALASDMTVTTEEIFTKTSLTAEHLVHLIREHLAITPGQTDHDIEQLLVWAETHPATSIRAKAARIRGDLTTLTDRHTADAAQRAAEQRVTRARAELETAQAYLRQVKGGGLTTPTSAAAAARRRSRKELAEIRTWARTAGHRVSDHGVIPKTIQAAYDAAHYTTDKKAAGR